MVFSYTRLKLHQLVHLDKSFRNPRRPKSFYNHTNIKDNASLQETRRFFASSRIVAKNIFGNNMQYLATKINCCYSENLPNKLHILHNNAPKLLFPPVANFLKQSLKRIVMTSTECCVTLLDMAMFLRVERVPFSGRRHLVFRSPERHSLSRTRAYVDSRVERMNRVDGKVLPSTHPKTLRVASIARQLGQGMHNVLGLNRDFNIVAYQPDNELVWTIGQHRKSTSDMLFDYTNKWFRKGYTKNLESRELKFFVIDSPTYKAYFTFGNLICVFTDMLDDCTDEGLAWVVGHEMGHSIGRHYMDQVMWCFPKLILRVAIMSIMSLNSIFPRPSKYEYVLKEIFNNFPGRRLELEADYIGMLLMASAGYDPRTAPRMLSSKYPWNVEVRYDEITSSHPRGRKRAEYLRNPKRMDVAMDLYTKVKMTQNNLQKN